MTAAKKVARAGLLTALALIFSYVEMLIPINFGVPGIKLGLANLVVMTGLFILTPAEVISISIARIFLVGLLFGNMAAIMYSLAGAVFSFIIMIIIKKLKTFSIIGISIVGGVCHNIAQLVVAMLVVENAKLIYYMPALLLSGAVAGLLVGIIGSRVVVIIKREN